MTIYLQRRPDGSTYGSYVIDRIVLGKRIKISTGSKDRKIVVRMDDMIDDLIDRGRESILRNLVDKEVTLTQLFERYQEGTLFTTSMDPKVLRPLKEVLFGLLDQYSEWTPGTQKRNRELVTTMFNKVGEEFESPLVQDLPKLLRRYREICEEKGTQRSFNMVRTCVNRLVKVEFGRSSPLYLHLTDVLPLKERPKRITKSRTPGQIDRLCEHLPVDYQGMVWTMCSTGVGWKEYGSMSSREDIKNPRIYIQGTKMDHKDERRRREVPFVYEPTPRVGTERMFQKVIKETSISLGMDPILPYTFRKCYSNWLMESGVPQWRVEMYMGHSPRSMTLRYQKTDVWGWLKEDGEKLRKWIDKERKKRGLKPS